MRIDPDYVTKLEAELAEAREEIAEKDEEIERLLQAAKYMERNWRPPVWDGS